MSEKELTIEQKRLFKVLENIKRNCIENPSDSEEYLRVMDDMLDILLCNDFFGTEGQTDPRGDGRNGEFNYCNIEGVD